MTNRNNMMTSLLTVGAAGAIIYGVSKGIQNGTFQRWQQNISNSMNSTQGQQNMQPTQNTANQQQENQSLTSNSQYANNNNPFQTGVNNLN